MSTEDLTGVARGASTLMDVLSAFEAKGYRGQFVARDGGTVECLSCHTRIPTTDLRADALRRLEGASDPAEMLAVVAVHCPNCDSDGTLVLNYGPEAPASDDEALGALDLPEARP
jgi:hypothetical protein